MNKEELEKIYEDMYDRLSYEDFKSYVFESIIPEVLKSVLPEWNKQTYISTYKNYIKPKIKELYNINL